MPTSGSDLDATRRLVVERGLARAAFEHLTVDAFLTLPFDRLGPTKALLKRFFSAGAWGPADDEALAAAVGPGDGTWRHDLDADVVLVHGWVDGRFGVRVSPGEATAGETTAGEATAGETTAGEGTAGKDTAGEVLGGEALRGGSLAGDALAGTFDGPVVPEATPNPRSIRFQVGAIPGGSEHRGHRRWYESAEAAADDPGPARLFAEFEEVANVLVGPDFVAVGLHRAADWERLLRPVLDVVTDELADPEASPDTSGPRVTGGPAGAGRPGSIGVGAGPAPAGAPAGGPGGERRLSRLERAWLDLGGLHPGAAADDLARVRSAAADDEPSRRQVAANLLGEADPEVAATEWACLVVDPVRSVRRAAVDAMVDAGRPELRALLEAALSDADAWVRWKALRGLAELGAGPSRQPIARLAADPDFRVRMEVAAALRQA